MEEGKLTVEKLEVAGAVLRAIAHPHRIQIIEILESGKQYTVSQLQEITGMVQAKVSHHLGLLRNRKVVKARREGKNVYYSLRQNLITKVIDCIDECSKDE